MMEDAEDARKKAEEAKRELRKSEERFRSVSQSASDAIITMDSVGNTVLWNRGAEGIFGWSEDEIIGKPITCLMPERFSKPHSEGIQRANHDKSSKLSGKTVEMCGVRKDGSEFPLERSIARWDTEGEVYYTGIIRDITERKLAREKLDKTLSELKRSNDELQQFAYVASHDLQEPLRMVSSYVQMLERRYKGRLDEDADDFIAYAVDGANRMHKLINALLEYSRVGTKGKDFSPVKSEEVLDIALKNLEIALKESGAEVTRDSLPQVTADETQIVQLFQNLIGNAVKFRNEKKPRIHVSAEQKGSEWVFSVRDNGIGIDKEFFDRIFVIFQRLHKRTDYEGTGIGLSVCKRIVERHGGRIWVESVSKKGTTFYFTLPVKVEKDNAEQVERKVEAG